VRQIFLVQNDDGVHTTWLHELDALQQRDHNNKELIAINEELPDDQKVSDYFVVTYAIQDSTVLPYIIVYTVRGKIIKCAPRINLDQAMNELLMDVAKVVINMDRTDEAYIIDSQEQIVYDALKSAFPKRPTHHFIPDSNLKPMTSDGSD